MRKFFDKGVGRIVAVTLLGAIALFSGCSKGGPSNKISSTAFDSAPADVKQLWTDGMAAWKGHHFPEAAASFVALQSKAGLSPQQTEELTRAMDEFGQEAFTAANKGDEAATKAVLTLRDAGGGKRGSGR